MGMDLNWNLEKILENHSILQLKKEMENSANSIFLLKGKLASSVANLKEFLKHYQQFSISCDLAYAYLGNKENEDLSNVESQNELFKFSNFKNKLTQKIIFWRNELLQAQNKVLNLLQDSDLKLYQNFFDRFYEFKKHQISDEAEFIIQYFSDYFITNQTTFSKLTNVDFKFKKIIKDHIKYELHPGNYQKFITDKDVKVRKQTYNNFWSVYFDHKVTLTTNAYYHWTLTSKLSKLYKYKSSLQSHLAKDFIDEKFYHFLLDQIKKNTNLILDWKKIIVKITKISNPDPWDWCGDLFGEIEDDFQISETKKLIKEALKILGSEYQKNIDYIFNNQLISWLPRKNKRSGAYSWGVWGADPYILMNWNNKYIDASTLIHELGHSIHTLFSSHNQPYIYHSYPIFLAEIASITNELLFGLYLYQTTKDNNKKKVILEKLIKEFIATVYRQGQFAEFEEIVHKKVDQNKPISYLDIKKIAYKLQKSYFPRLETEKKINKYAWLWGIYVPHFFSDFYVFKYATGMIAASSFVKKILTEGDKGVSDYLTFLKSGSSEKPLDILKKCGIDLLSEETYQQAFSLLKDWINQLNRYI